MTHSLNLKSKLTLKPRIKPISTPSESVLLNESNIDNSVILAQYDTIVNIIPKTLNKPLTDENTYLRWIYGKQFLISTENTYIYDLNDHSLIGKVLDVSNIEWY